MWISLWVPTCGRCTHKYRGMAHQRVVVWGCASHLVSEIVSYVFSLVFYIIFVSFMWVSVTLWLKSFSVTSWLSVRLDFAEVRPEKILPRRFLEHTKRGRVQKLLIFWIFLKKRCTSKTKLPTGKLMMWSTRDSVVTLRTHLIDEFWRVLLRAQHFWRMSARSVSISLKLRHLSPSYSKK